MDYNPYAPPREEIEARGATTRTVGGGRLRVEGKNLVIPQHFYPLPPVCVVSGETTGLTRWQRTLHWHAQWVFLLLLLNVLIYIIVALIVRKKADVTFYIRPEERRGRRNIVIVGTIGLIGCIFGIGLAAATEMVIGLAASFVGLIVFIVMLARGRMPYPTRIKDGEVWVAGIKPEVMQRILRADRAG